MKKKQGLFKIFVFLRILVAFAMSTFIFLFELKENWYIEPLLALNVVVQIYFAVENIVSFASAFMKDINHD